MLENLLANCKFLICKGASAAGTGDNLDGAIIDMAQDEGYDGIMVVWKLGDVTATAILNLRLMGSALANGSSPSIENETGVTAAAGAADQDNLLLLLDSRGPANRYVFARLVRATANVVSEAAFYILYKPRKKPVTQGADVLKAAYDWIFSS